VEFGLLGPLQVLDDGREVPVTGAKQRRLLAALLLRSDEHVAPGQLIEVLWPGEQPANPRNALQQQVAQLRRALGPQLLVSHPSGYSVETVTAKLDAHRFDELVRRGRTALAADRGAEAVVDFDAALALWRGPALEEFAHEPFAVAEAARLEEGRRTVVEDRFDALLAAGGGADLVADLQSAVADEPLRERLRGQLMRALFRAGRQADALAVFHETRQVLVEELGVVPGPALSQLHEQLLRHEDDLLPAAPTGRSGSGPQLRARLPAPVTELIGRDRDLDRVRTLLRASRLVTLTGPGGVGKTRLATEVARTTARETGDIAALVELASSDGGARLPDTVAEALGLGRPEPAGATPAGRDALDRVVDALRDRQALLVLDNAEHLVDDVAPLAIQLLETLPGLRLLVTSREPLHLTGETLWSLPSLGSPPVEATVDLASLASHGATRLFLDRATANDPSFEPDDGEASAIAQLCRRLDGIPLAIEIAAARLRSSTVLDLIDGLESRFELLTGTDRTRPTRQRTLRALIDWSWERCDTDERELFQRLSVFVGPVDLPLVEATCRDARLPTARLRAALERLVDRSLVVRERVDGRLRFRVLETLRAYAAERLDASGQRADLEARHLEALTGLARHEVPRLRTEEQLEARARLDLVTPDLRAALTRAHSRADPRGGGALAAELCWSWYLRGERDEVIAWASQFTDAAPRDAALLALFATFLGLGGSRTVVAPDLVDEPLELLRAHGSPTDRALGELVAADLAAMLGVADRLGVHVAAAREAAIEAEDPSLVATTDFVVAIAPLLAGDHVTARAQLELALAGFDACGDRWGRVQCRYALLGLELAAGDPSAALGHAEAAATDARVLGMDELRAVVEAQRCEAAIEAGDLDTARLALGIAQPIVERTGARFLEVQVAIARAGLGLASGELTSAEQALARVVEVELDGTFTGALAIARTRLAQLAQRRGDLDLAQQHLELAVELARTTQDPRSLAPVLERLAGVRADAGRLHDAALLLGSANELRTRTASPAGPATATSLAALTASLRAQLDDDQHERLTAHGRTVPLDELPLVPIT
jgi:predicted ATPase/DNA-binding SARP family transcriptional activator